ncbi:hypothetical protein EMA8858_01238 [Emticicia aquatica]|uniref:Bulb-type lectin domain-containing protein n=1 Tax=Emticicia aquatica TaxID=1681835 RepID=A0ABN8ETR5_9BACT|nr:3-coathanger stack domain-containing protein [Emticicia aquatica]CAH0995118.1 hypothetical protein EMA8858_01238 [Emticicia aquatica]
MQYKNIHIILTHFLFFLAYTDVNAQTPSILWQKNYGGSLYDKAESIIETKDGNYVIAGHSQSNDFDLTFNHGNYDCWVVKINNIGNIVWKKSFGGSNNDFFRTIIQTPDDGFLCIGETNSSDGDINHPIGQIDLWVVKLNNLGNIIWQKNYGGNSNDIGFSACLSTDGNYIVAGNEESNNPYIPDNKGLMDFWVLKIDTLGNIIWQKNFGGSENEYLRSIKNTTDGGFILSGNSKSTDGNISNNFGGLDIWVLKVDNSGNLLWQNNFGGTKDDYSKNIIEDKDGNFVVVGETFSFDNDSEENHSAAQERDFLVVKINNLGQKIWSRCFGGSGNEYARSVLQSNDGQFIVVGESYSNDGQAPNNHGDADFWLIKINQLDGNLVWQKTFGGKGHDEPNSIVETFDNSLIIVGNSAQPIGNGDVTQNYGDDDFWVIKLKNNECSNNLSFEKNIPFGEYNFKSQENINSKVKILSNSSKVIYSSGKSIQLNNGFSTTNGSVFEAKIEGCFNE